MKVYFIRHGESEGNAKHIHQPFDSPLSETGKRQAQAVAQHFKNISVDAILASDLGRAQDTARYLANDTGLTIVTEPALRELRRPTELYGRSHFRPQTIKYVLALLMGRNDKQARYKDGENLSEVHARVDMVLATLEGMSATHKHVVVYSHAVFLEILTTFLCAGKKGSFFSYLPIFSPLSPVPNAAITTASYHPTGENAVCEWQIEKLNDTTHLGN